MLVETSLRELGISEVADAARVAESLGFDGLTFSEVRQDPFIAATVAATATQRVQLATSVAIAFPRSPMLVAYQTRNLQDLSGGRFSVGLGTQVRGHIQRRFSSEWDPPGPRLREYVQSLRAIWQCWQGEAPLDFRGHFYSFTLMTPEFNLGPSGYPTRIQLAAVNPYNIATAATLCDGLRVHSFCTAEYLRDVIWPRVERAAAAAGRSLDGFEMIGCGFIATGPTLEQVARAREWVRRRVAFYASTRAYAPVLEHHGWGELGPPLRALIAEQRWSELSTLVDDTMLDHFCVAAPYEDLAERVSARLAGLVDRIHFVLPEDTQRERTRIERMLEGLRQVPTAHASYRPAGGTRHGVPTR
ncbi:MAG TPA: TIGR03617 family F420-dependent LLM class oxidoreductase [Chloroflexota bacterium]